MSTKEKAGSPISRRQLLQNCQEEGMRLLGGSLGSADGSGEQIPFVELPQLLYDLDKLMPSRLKLPMDRLDFDAMMALGNGLCTAEETIEFLRRYHREHGQMPDCVFWLRCCNNGSSPGTSLVVSCYYAHDYDIGVEDLAWSALGPFLTGLIKK